MEHNETMSSIGLLPVKHPVVNFSPGVTVREVSLLRTCNVDFKCLYSSPCIIAVIK
jgi:hypothetical protein